MLMNREENGFGVLVSWIVLGMHWAGDTEF